MFECPNCLSQARRLVAYTEPSRLGCDNCGTPKKRFSVCGLNQTDDKWFGNNGEKHRITSGKRREIESRKTHPEYPNRMISMDNSGREPQY